MTVLVALSSIDDLNTPITLTSQDITTEGESGLSTGERFRLSDLATLTLVASSNDGASALARTSEEITQTSFTQLAQTLAKKIGLVQSYFLNPTGLDESGTTSGSYGSAHDVALMLAHAIKNYPNIFDETSRAQIVITALSGKQHVVKNTNTTVGTHLGIIASKTGTTDLAGGNLVIAFDAGPLRPIIVSVLHSADEERFKDVANLAEDAISALSNSSQ